MRFIWLILGWLCVIIAAVGILLPLLPTVPFLLLAALCFAKSSNAAHQWLINHKLFGPSILAWHDSGSIRRSAKIMASFCIITAFSVSFILNVVWWALALQALVLLCVSVFIWSRPEL